MTVPKQDYREFSEKKFIHLFFVGIKIIHFSFSKMYTGTTHDFKPCKLPCWRSARDMQRRALVYPGGIQFHTGFNAATILRLALNF